MPEVLSAAAGPAALRLLRQVLAARQADDPLAPVTVVVPSNYAALSLRRHLAAAASLVNVGFLTLARVAELLGGPALARAGRRPLSPAVLAHTVRRALATDPGIFKEVASHPATERAVARAYTDVRALGPPAGVPPDVARLIQAVRGRLAPHWYDAVDLLTAAAAAVRADAPALADIGHVVVYAPRGMQPAERRLLDALGDRATLIDIAFAAPEVDVVVDVPDPDQEVRVALRGTMERLGRGVPLHRMAILYPAAEPYARLLAQQLAAAGIPASGPGVRRTRELVAGVTLLGLLRLPETNWPRENVIAWLSSAPVLDRSGRRVPVGEWDMASRAAGVIEGADQWQDRLALFAAGRNEELAALGEAGEGEDDPNARSRRRLERDIEAAESLRRFMAELVAASDCNGCGTWAQFRSWAGTLLERWLGPDAAHGSWPAEQQEGWRQVDAALDRLAGLDAVLGVGSGEPVERDTFVRALDTELDAPAGRLGTFGDGVFVAPLHAARATDFDTVFILGMAEGTMPRIDRTDGLLPSPLDPADRLAEDHDALLAALASAPERILVWPRFDPRRGRERQPSRWLPDDPARRHTVESFEAGLAVDDGAALSLADYDLAALTAWWRAGGAPTQHFLTRDVPRLAAGLEAAAARTGPRLTRFDGLVGADATAAAGLGSVLSPTSLEVYATCPMRYFLRQVLRVAAPDKPEEILRIRPMDKGTLVHAILEQYVRTLLAGEPRSLDRLLAIAQRACAEYEARGLTGKPLYWRYERELLLRELRRFYEEDGFTPVAAELTFGMDGEEPVVVTLDDGRELRFRGSADRVDRVDRAGEQGDGLVVTDYKTGSLREYEDLRRNLATDPVDRGRRLQLPLYALAAADRHPTPEPVHARYWFTSERGRFESIGYPVDDRVLARLRQVLRVVVDGIAAGAFPARPGEVDRQSYRNCTYCDYDRLCQRDRSRQWDRKRHTPALAGYVALAEGSDE
jgi:RecB family exonuclease